MLKGLFNFVFIWLLFFSSLAFTVYQIQRPNFLASEVKEAELYERLTSNIGAILPAEAKNSLPFSDGELKEIVTEAVPKEAFYNLTTAISDSYLEYITSREASLNFNYPLEPVKSGLITAVTAKTQAKYAALPVCKSNQLKGWSIDGRFPDCQLPSSDPRSAQVNGLLAQQASQLTAEWPDYISAPEPTESLVQARDQVSQVMKVVRIIWGITLGFLLLYLLIFRSRAFLSLAAIFILAGALEIGFSLIGWQYVAEVIVGLLNSPGQNMAGLTADMVGILAEILRRIMSQLGIISLVIGGSFLVIGIISHFHKGVTAVTAGK